MEPEEAKLTGTMGCFYTSAVFYFSYHGLMLSFAELIPTVYIVNLALGSRDASCLAVAVTQISLLHRKSSIFYGEHRIIYTIS